VGHVLEPATSGRAKCRGCGQVIARGELRFGERLPNPFGEGEMSAWFHPLCAAWKRPEVLLQALEEASVELPDRGRLARAARASQEHRRRPRVDGAERAPGSQAKCRCCHQGIARGTWRIRLVYYEDGRFAPGGFVHLGCRAEYFEGSDIDLLEQVLHFSPKLGAADREELQRTWESGKGA
jgi:hypothetical protein